MVIIVLFGSKKLPHAARSLGQSMRILKKEVQGLHEDEDETGAPAPATALPAAQLAAGPAPRRRRSRTCRPRSTRSSSRSATCSGPRRWTPSRRRTLRAPQQPG